MFADQHEELDGLLGFRFFHHVPESGDSPLGRGGAGGLLSGTTEAVQEIGEDMILIHFFSDGEQTVDDPGSRCPVEQAHGIGRQRGQTGDHLITHGITGGPRHPGQMDDTLQIAVFPPES